MVLVGKEVDVQFETIVCPTAELKLALLFVERKVRDVDGTGALEDRLGNPQDATIVGDHGVGVTVLFESVISTASKGVMIYGVMVAILRKRQYLP